jgi:hypothetical protein
MKFTRGTDKETWGKTGGVGRLPSLTYDEIVEAIGEPEILNADKVKAVWVLKLGNIMATIYDYKSKVDPRNNTFWHVGGNKGPTSFLLAIGAIRGHGTFELIFSHRIFDGMDERYLK